MKYAIIYYKKDPFGENAISVAVVVQDIKSIKVHFVDDYMNRILNVDPDADQYLMKNLPTTLKKQIEEEQLYLSSPNSSTVIEKNDPDFLRLLSAGFRGNIQFNHIEETAIPNVDDAVRELEEIYAQ